MAYTIVIFINPKRKRISYFILKSLSAFACYYSDYEDYVFLSFAQGLKEKKWVSSFKEASEDSECQTTCYKIYDLWQ